MKPRVAVLHDDQIDGRERNPRLIWGLSARLPRWRAFDGRRSKVAINWTRRRVAIDV